MSRFEQITDHFDRVVDVAPCGIMLINAKGEIALVNEQLCRIFGYQADELVGQPLETLLPQRYRDTHVHLREGFYQQPSVRSMGPGRDLTGRHQDNSEFPVEIGLAPITLNDGSSATVATVIDITTRKILENNLKQANSNLENFTHIASHDLKAPLRGIRSLIEWIKEDLGEINQPELLHNFERVELRLNKMETLIEDLLRFSRATRQSSETTVINLQELIQQEIELLAAPTGFSFQMQLYETSLITAKTPLATVLRNLLSNAIKHHNKGQGTIVISTQAANGFCKFTVIDDGPGIPVKARMRVFQLFQTLDKKTAHSSGIGLAVCKQLVEAHGGTIEILDGANETGCAVSFTWPQFLRRDING